MFFEIEKTTDNIDCHIKEISKTIELNYHHQLQLKIDIILIMLIEEK